MRFILSAAPFILYALAAYIIYKCNENLLSAKLPEYFAAVSTLAAALVALFKDRYTNFVDKPILTLCKKDNDSLSLTPRKNGAVAIIAVKNIGRSIAKNTFAQIELIKSSDGFNQDYEMPRMNLYLGFHNKDVQKCDIYPDLKEVFDVLYKDDNDGPFKLTTSIEKDGIPLDKGTYIFKLIIGADNADFIEKKLVIDTDKDPAEVKIQPWQEM